MALGPGALSLLLQPTHVNNPARGDGVFQAARIQEEKQQNQWYRGQREQETAEQRRQFDVSHGFEQKKFDYLGQEKRRLEKAAAWDELLDADASQDPQKMLAAWQKARAKGINVPGYEEHLNNLFGEKKPAGTPAAAPADKKDAALSAELDKVQSDALEGIQGPFGSDIGKNVGQGIGDGWEVVETPPEARTAEPPMERSPFTGQMAPPAELGPPQGLAGGLHSAPQPQQPPGALVAYDEETGQAIGTVSPETAIARSRARLREALSPLVENARTPEEQRAAAIAMDTGQRGVGTMPVDKLIASAQERYDAELGRDTAKTVARGGKAAGTGEVAAGAPPDKTMYERAGRSPEEIRANIAIGNYVHTKLIQPAQRIHKTQERIRLVGLVRSLAAKAGSSSGLAQRQAIREVIRESEGARQTDADLNYILNAPGAIARLHMKLNEWVAGGTIPHNFKQQLLDYATLLSAWNRTKQEEARDYIYEQIMKDPTLRDSVTEEDAYRWAEQGARGAGGVADTPGISKKGRGSKSEVDSLVEELEGAD